MNKKLILIFAIFIFSFPLFSQSKSEIENILKQNEEIYQHLEEDLNSIKLLVDVLKSNNENVDLNVNSIKDISNTAIDKINKLNTNIEIIKKALISNNDDMGVIIGELGDMTEELNEYKRYVNSLKTRMTRNEILINTIIPITTLPLVGFGIYDITNNNSTRGKVELYSGIGLFVGAELIYNGGHFIFKLW